MDPLNNPDDNEEIRITPMHLPPRVESMLGQLLSGIIPAQPAPVWADLPKADAYTPAMLQSVLNECLQLLQAALCGSENDYKWEMTDHNTVDYGQQVGAVLRREEREPMMHAQHSHESYALPPTRFKLRIALHLDSEPLTGYARHDVTLAPFTDAQAIIDEARASLNHPRPTL